MASKKWAKAYADRGDCTSCGKRPPVSGMSRCEECRTTNNAYRKPLASEYYKDRRRKAVAVGNCTTCFTRPKIEGRACCAGCAVKRSESASNRWINPTPEQLLRRKESAARNYEKNKAYKLEWGRARRLQIKTQVMSHYGWECACCGEEGLDFLSLDHINGDGAKHRKEQGTGKAFYLWVIANNFPTDLQILCFNCNCAKRTGTHCPHQIQKIPHVDQLDLFSWRPNE